MKIGFIKIGLKTYFNGHGKSCQGSNHELTTLFELFEKNGHECHMVSASDKYEKYTDIENLDWLFVFNGPCTRYNPTSIMQKSSFVPFLEIINNTKIPYIYFHTDARIDYDIIENKNFKRKPDIILSQEKENYGHLEKIILYNKELKEHKKDITVGVVMNDTDKKRSREMLKWLNWLDVSNIKAEIKGKWKVENELNTGVLEEDKVNDYLSRVKYTLNLTVNPLWVNQKYYEYVLNDVICFQYRSDLDNLIMPENDYRRVIDEIEFDEKIQELEDNPELYEKVLQKQKDEIKKEYLDGSFIYEFVLKKMESTVKLKH